MLLFQCARAHKLVDDAFVIIEGNASRFSTGGLTALGHSDLLDPIRIQLHSTYSGSTRHCKPKHSELHPRGRVCSGALGLLRGGCFCRLDQSPMGHGACPLVFGSLVRFTPQEQFGAGGLRQDAGGHDEQAERALQLYDRLACEENQLLGPGISQFGREVVHAVFCSA